MRKPLITFLITFIISGITLSQNYWEQLNGPHGGTALSFTSTSDGNVFAGSDYNQKGVYRSTDGGFSWQRKSNGISLADRQVDWMVVDDSSYIIIGTNSHIGARIYKSTDNGENWFETEILGGSSCAVNDSGHIYVGNTGYAQYSVSKDGGYTWTHYSHPSPFINCVTINDSGHIFIGGNYTGYRSKDYGASWITLSLPDGINSIAVAPNGNLFAGCSREYAANSGVYRSTDNGDSWAPVKEGFRVYASHNIVINNYGDIVVGTWGTGIWKSTDNGDTWIQYNSGLGHLYIKSMHITNNGTVYAGLNGGGIYRSTNNGESWTQVGITVTSVKKIVIDPSNNDIFTAVSGVARSTDAGQTWIPGGIGLSDYDVKSIAINNGYVFAGTPQNNNGCLFRSSDNGVTWTRSDNGISNSHTFAISISPSGDLFAGTYPGGIYSSSDNGENWINRNYGTNLGEIRSVEFNSAGDIFVASWGQGIYRKLFGDTTWTSIASGYYTCLFIGSNDYVYTEHSRSTDNGDTWFSMPIVGNNISSFAENSLGHLFCGTYNFGNGVSRSTDYGDTWEQINTGLPTMDIRSVAVDSDDYLYAGTNGYSMFRSVSSTITGLDNITFEPISFSLEQNYPNPFNPSTKIYYTIPSVISTEGRNLNVSLRVYDILGEEISTLVNEEKLTGTYEVEFSATKLPSGVYLYQLKAGDFIQTKKMILLK